jgi:hypothetical protein
MAIKKPQTIFGGATDVAETKRAGTRQKISRFL